MPIHSASLPGGVDPEVVQANINKDQDVASKILEDLCRGKTPSEIASFSSAMMLMAGLKAMDYACKGMTSSLLHELLKVANAPSTKQRPI